MEVQKSGLLLTFPEVLAQAGRRGCATHGLPRFVIRLNSEDKMILSVFKFVFSVLQ